MNMHSSTSGPCPSSPLKAPPVDNGLPIIGHSLSVLRDPITWGRHMFEKHGPVVRYKVFMQDVVSLIGVSALELMWMDKNKVFSAEGGYDPFLGELADTSLLLMDHEKHRAHRHALNPAFKAAVMRTYLAQMQAAFTARINEWQEKGSFKFYPEAKQLTLDVATSVFIGLDEGPEKQRVNKALTDLLAFLVSVVRLPIPGTAYYRGKQARNYLASMLRAQIPERRKHEGNDIFSRLCHETRENGENFTDDEIIDHLLTFWVAGHDTLASSLTTLTYMLGKHPESQLKLRDEIASVDLNGRAPTMEDLNKLDLCSYAFKEALRLVPPVMNTPRRALKDFDFFGYHIPKGIQVFNSIYAVHHDENIWPDPESFDPMRFAPENTPKDRHRFAWSPFGGGAHKCIGMIFAQIQAKVFLLNLLPRHEIILPEGYEMDIQFLPTPRPKDGLPLSFAPITD